MTQHIELRGIAKTYADGHEALRGVNLLLGEGMFGLLGPNGAGKTTLLSILVLSLEPTRGERCYGELDPRRLRSRAAIRRMLGYLPQDFQPIGHLTGIEYLLYCARLREVALTRHELERRARRLLDAVDLTDAAHRAAGTYSGGMRRRLGIAQAMVHAPRLLVIDEPTAGLDPEERIRFRNLIAEVAESVAVVLSTHICEDIEATCDRVGILSGGTIVFDGRPGDLMREMGAAPTLEVAYARELARSETAPRLESSKGALDPNEQSLPPIAPTPHPNRRKVLLTQQSGPLPEGESGGRARFQAKSAEVATFLGHEASTQLRSARFRMMAGIYVIATSLPAVLLFVLARRARYAIGSANYATLLDLTQPLLTLLLALVLSVDAITREREEGSFPVVSLAPISAAGYLLYRWLAVLTVALPVTLLPRIVGLTLAAVQGRQWPMLTAFAGGWLLGVLPVLVLISAFAIALGTICGNTTVAIVTGAMLLTGGLEIVNNISARWHLHFDGIVSLLAFDPSVLRQIQWSLAGYYVPRLPTEAAYPFAAILDRTLPEAALLFGLSTALLGMATMYLRRTRRDLRPWRTRTGHPLRTFIRVVNHLRGSYSPDGSIGSAEWAAAVLGVVLLGGSIAFLTLRARAFERLGALRYAAYTQSAPLPMAASVVPVTVRIRAALSADGSIRSRGELTLRNDGASPVSHLGFELNPLEEIRGIDSSAGRLRVMRVWQRVGIDVDPPLAPRQSLTLRFELAGKPGEVWMPIPWSGGWRAKWQRYLAATESVDLTDLSRSATLHDVDEAHVALDARDLMPVPRYSPWRVDRETDRFDEESVRPAARVELVLSQPFAAIADSCGHLATHGAALESRCAMALASYRVAGGPLATDTIAPGVLLAYIPAQASLVPVQGPALAAAVARVENAWSGLPLVRPIVYVETPTDPQRRRLTMLEWRTAGDISGSGTLQLIPENVFIRYRGIDEGIAAGALIVNALSIRRTVVPGEADFFADFYRAAAGRRVGTPVRATAVVAAPGLPRESLLARSTGPRLACVTYALETRAGAPHVVEGINDFIAAGPKPGTARELFADIGHRAGIDLTRMYEDYVAGDKAPRLTLAGVTFRRSGESWEVRGALHNEGSGETFCDIALRTAAGSLRQTLRVDTGQQIPFVFTTTAAPHTLQLDPDRSCYREAFIGAIESVDYRGGS